MWDASGKVRSGVARVHAVDRSKKGEEDKWDLSDMARSLDLFLLTLWVVHPAHLSYFIHVCQTGLVRSAFQRGDLVPEGQ